MQITKHVYTNKPARYYINGKRISRERYQWALIYALRLECLQTVRLRGHFVHYACAVLPANVKIA